MNLLLVMVQCGGHATRGRVGTMTCSSEGRIDVLVAILTEGIARRFHPFEEVGRNLIDRILIAKNGPQCSTRIP